MKFFKTYPKEFTPILIKKLIDEEVILLKSEFQNDKEWTLLEKSRLIESLITEIQLPTIYLSDNNTNGTISIIDGLQRLKTIYQFMNNEFCMKGLEYLDESFENIYYKQDIETNKRGLERDHFFYFNSRRLIINMIQTPTLEGQCSLEDKYSLYKRFN